MTARIIKQFQVLLYLIVDGPDEWLAFLPPMTSSNSISFLIESDSNRHIECAYNFTTAAVPFSPCSHSSSFFLSLCSSLLHSRPVYHVCACVFILPALSRSIRYLCRRISSSHNFHDDDHHHFTLTWFVWTAPVVVIGTRESTAHQNLWTCPAPLSLATTFGQSLEPHYSIDTTSRPIHKVCRSISARFSQPLCRIL